MKTIRFVVLLIFTAALFLIFSNTELQAMAQFARKYDADCSMCHFQGAYPRLNKMGYEFRRAGFRMPGEIGQEEGEFNFGDYFSTRVRTRYLNKITDNELADTDETESTFQVRDITIFPATGAFLKNWSSLVEVEFEEEGGELEGVIEQLFITYNRGEADSYFYVRTGTAHSIQGFGASDRPLGLNKNILVDTSVNGIKIWRELVGLEAGYTWNDTNITIGAVNGYNDEVGKSATEDDNLVLDLYAFVNQFIGDTEGTISAYYYQGVQDVFDAATDTVSYRDNYTRWAIWANYPPIEKLDILAGYGGGSNEALDTTTGDEEDYGVSGWFAELQVPAQEHLIGFLRYATFEPNDDVDDNEITAYNIGVSAPFDFVQFIAEYQSKVEAQDEDNNKTVNTIGLQALVLF